MIVAALQVLNKILQTKNYNFIKTNSLTAAYFKGYEAEFNFIEEHYKKFGNIPDELTFLQNFPNFDLTEVNETDDYLLDRLQEDYGYHKMAPVLRTFDEKLKEDSRLAYNYLLSEMANMKPHTVCKGIDIIANAAERWEKYEARKTEPDAAVIKTGFKELDDVFGGWEYGDELVTIVARTNMGKCHAKGTLIRMADGTRKAVEEICVGDYVQSEKSVNKVTALHNGKSKGYKIIPNRGVPFVISSEHILTLLKKCYVQKDNVIKRQDEIVDITIEDYLSLNDFQKRKLFLYRPELYFSEKQLKIDPYILGLWLGDGNSREPIITTMDPEIVTAWKQFGETLCLHCVKKENYDKNRQVYSKASEYSLVDTKGKPNPFTNILKSYNVLQNKHIPAEYLTSSTEQRLQLLAGIIDTDGYYDKKLKMYQIVTKSKDLAMDYVSLITSLGFKYTLRETNIKLPKKEEYGLYYEVKLSGPLYLIPVKLERKKVPVTELKRNPLTTKFKVQEIEEIEYYGFECDGDHRYLLWDGTLTHNSWLLLKFMSEAWKQGKRVGLYSGEMSHLKLGYRFDALFGHFSNKCLTQGGQVDGYQEYINQLTTVQNPFIIITQKEFGGRPTVQKIRNFVEENQIEILGIDQFSLMEDGRAKGNDPTRLRMAHIAEDLFLLSSEYRIPILGLAQANREAVKKEGEMDAPGIENIKECDDIAHNSSKCIGMKQSNFGLVLDVIKNREGRVGDKLLYSWDIDSGHFSYIPSGDDAVSAPVRQQVKQEASKQAQNALQFNPF